MRSTVVLVGWVLVGLPTITWSWSLGRSSHHTKTVVHKAAADLVTGESKSFQSLPEPQGPAFVQQTPHSGRHFWPSHPAYRQRRRLWKRRPRSRFTEGWYYRLTIPNTTDSFAFIVSIEDPKPIKSDLTLVCIQIVGPKDGYLVQADTEDSKFWAWKDQQGLGCNFEYQPHVSSDNLNYLTALDPEDWKDAVLSGFQILPTRWLGKIRGHDGTMGGVLEGQGVSGSCDFDFTVTPLCGWGDAPTVSDKRSPPQKSTGGWLASFRVFEPHWQVTMADGRATGTIVWNNQTYEFDNAPFYAEKNWGAALPMKWYWTQCNSFDGYDQLSVTAGGGIRTIPFGRREALGMVSVHYNGTFYEAVPWSGEMEWKAKWGSWELRGNCTDGDRPFEAIVTYHCDAETTPGLVFRAPTPDQGMVYFCRDTFEAQTTLSLWELEWDAQDRAFVRKPGPPLIDNATSSQGGAEIGGGPWWDEWKGRSVVKQPIKSLLQLPSRVQRLRKRSRR